jgi:hypothetical protein
MDAYGVLVIIVVNKYISQPLKQSARKIANDNLTVGVLYLPPARDLRTTDSVSENYTKHRKYLSIFELPSCTDRHKRLDMTFNG